MKQGPKYIKIPLADAKLVFILLKRYTILGYWDICPAIFSFHKQQVTQIHTFKQCAIVQVLLTAHICWCSLL